VAADILTSCIKIADCLVDVPDSKEKSANEEEKKESDN
jgi:hypothetical protein